MSIRLFVKIVFFALVAMSLAACAPMSKPSSNSSFNRSVLSSKYYLRDDNEVVAADYPTNSLPDGNLWKDLRGDLELLKSADSVEVRSQIRWFQTHQYYLNHTIARGVPYIYFLYQETRKLHLPAELALVPINESAYNPFLYSRAGATGLWQMMPGTASGFGLKINWWYDGRRDVVASTAAALKYLTYLHYFFNNDWLLALAAYNAGEGKVQAAILHNQRRNLPTDFWSLPLPHETRAYVPKLLALAAIFSDPDRYNVKLLPVNNGPYFAKVDVGQQIDINQAAKLADVDTKTIRMLNPGFRRFASDPDGPYTLLIPAAKVDVFNQRLANLADKNFVVWQKHMVKRGETLVSIARSYHIDSALLRRVNELANNKVRLKQELLIPKNYHDEAIADLTTSKNASVAEERIPGPKQVVHTVQSGETLYSVAKKYGVKAHQVAYWNQINGSDEVGPSDELVIWQEPGSNAKPVKLRTFAYKVKPGDTLSSITKRFHVEKIKLMRINHLHGSVLRVGQTLHVPGVRPEKVVYKHGKKSNHKAVHHQVSKTTHRNGKHKVK